MHEKENQLRKREMLSKVYDYESIQSKIRSIPVYNNVSLITKSQVYM